PCPVHHPVPGPAAPPHPRRKYPLRPMAKPATSLPRVPAATARRLLLGAQGLLDDPRRKATPPVLYDLIARMGFVQIDSINVVARAHHLTLASRLQSYRPA